MTQKEAVNALLAEGFVQTGSDEGAVVMQRGADVRIVRRDGGVRRCDRRK